MTSTREEQAAQVKEFLEQGEKVEEIPQGRSGYVEGQSRSAWGAPRKKTAAAEPVMAKKPQKKV